MTPQQFSKALGLTESAGNPNAVGDSGQAYGRYQIHPCWLWDQCSKVVNEPRLDYTWDQWMTIMVENFFAAHNFLPPVEVAMWFHLGHKTLFADKDWDAPYASRFTKYAATV